jgi:hypothetical protein
MPIKAIWKHFSAFRTAAEEVADMGSRKKGGPAHMSATGGRVVQTPGEEKPYKVVMQHEGRGETEHPVSTVAEGEALLRRESPRVPERDTLRDRPKS